MKYKSFKDADKIVNRSSYIVNNAKENKNNWSKFFGNNNPIHLEIGMGKGNFIIDKAQHLFIDDYIYNISDENITIESYQDDEGQLIVTILLKTGLIAKYWYARSFYIEDHGSFNKAISILDGEQISNEDVEITIVKEDNEFCIKVVFNFGVYPNLSSEERDNIWLYIEPEEYFFVTIMNEEYDRAITIK